MSVEFVTPVGRLVQGSLFELQDREDEKTKEKYKVAYVGIAIDKRNPDWPAFWALLNQEARAGWPQFFDQQGNCVKNNFSWKVVDGDGIDDNGKDNKTKPGFAGHWVVRFGGNFLPKVFQEGRMDPTMQITDKNVVPLGHYVRVVGNAKANVGSQTPGLYVNAGMVVWVGNGERIETGPDWSEVYKKAAAPAYVPPGMTAPGSAPGSAAYAGTGGPGTAAAPAPMVGPGGAPAGLGAAPMAGPGAAPSGIQPNHTFVNNAIGAAPVPAPAPMAAPPQPQYQMTATAQGTREQYHAAGWNDQQIIDNGFMVRIA